MNDVSEEAVDAAVRRKIKDGVKDYVQAHFKGIGGFASTGSVTRKNRRIATTPAYTRRHLKIDRP